MDRKGKVILVSCIAFSFLPIWTSGLRERMILLEWIANHSMFGGPSEYLPEELYLPDQPVPLEGM